MQEEARLEDRERDGGHDHRHSAAGWGVLRGLRVSVRRQGGVRKIQSSLGNSQYHFKGCS